VKPYLRPYFYFNMRHGSYGLLYQVTCSLGTPYRILEFSGPYKGSCADVTIFRKSIICRLRDGERVLCDKAYAAESKCMTSPRGKYGSLSPIGRSQFIAVSRIRQINERVIGRCKQWGLLKKQWSLSFDLHERCALCIAKLTQLQLYSNPLT
jgi:hypothetical protein